MKKIFYEKKWIDNDGNPIERPILSIDFDGVIHLFTSGWQGPLVILDPPVKGAFEALYTYQKYFDLYIYSSRSGFEGGPEAMRDWMYKWFEIYKPKFRYEEYNIVDKLIFTTEKPPAFATLDDRGITFNGIWPTAEELMAFKPWYIKE